MSRTDTYPGWLGRLDSGSWRWQVSIGGERISETWSADLSKREAERKARTRYNELDERQARGEGGDTRLSALIGLYKREKFHELAPETVRGYKYDLTALETFFIEEGDDPRIRNVGRGDVKAFLSWRRTHKPDGEKRSEPLSGHSVQRAQSVCSGLFREAFEREWIPANPASRINVKTPDREYVLLSEEEYGKLLEAAGDHDMLRIHLLLCGEAGLRKSESLALRWEDVDLDAGFLHVVSGRDGRQTKGKRSRYVPLTSRLRTALRRHKLQYQGRTYDGQRSPYVVHHVTNDGTASAGDPYTRFTKVLTRIRGEIGIPEEWRLHDLRHRCITRWLREGHSPAKVRKAAGHAKLSTTLQYEHLVRADLEDMVGDEEDERAELADMVG